LTSDRTLRPGVVHVWQVQLGTSLRNDALWSTLSAEERERAGQLVHPAQQRRFVAAHAGARRIIGHHLDVAPATIEFEQGERGKPRVRKPRSPENIEFSLSHSGELAVVGITRGAALGVDVEWHGRPLKYRAIAERFFSTAEREVFRRIPEESGLLAEYFFACWTRKEAYLKATGQGIARGLRHFDVTVEPKALPRLTADRLDPGAVNRWALSDITVPSGYSAALAVEIPLESVVLHSAQDTAWLTF